MGQVGKSMELVEREFQFDPTSGYVTIETWQGSKDAILGLQSSYNAGLVRTDVSHKGPLYTLEARIAALSGGGGGAEQPTDYWEIDTELVQESIFASPSVLAAAGGGTATLALWKKDIEAKIKAGTGPDPGWSSQETALYNAIARGQESHEVKRIVLTMVRSVSTNYAQQITLNAEEVVYTTTKLISTFSVPAPVASRLPPDPATTPAGTVWAWMERKQSSRLVLGTNKVEENRDWVFAAWTTITHTLIS